MPHARPARVEPSRAALRRLIAEEYRAMPGMSLTARQAARLWGADRDTCLEVLEALVAEGRLSGSSDRCYRVPGRPEKTARPGR